MSNYKLESNQIAEAYQNINNVEEGEQIVESNETHPSYSIMEGYASIVNPVGKRLVESDEEDDESEDVDDTKEVDEGELPPALKAAIDKKNGKKSDEDEDTKEVDEGADEGDDEDEDTKEVDEGDDEDEDTKEVDEGDDEDEDTKEVDEGDDEDEENVEESTDEIILSTMVNEMLKLGDSVSDAKSFLNDVNNKTFDDVTESERVAILKLHTTLFSKSVTEGLLGKKKM